MRTLRKYAGNALAILALWALGLGVGGYILSEQRLRFPYFEERPFVVAAEIADAQAVQPGQGQTVRIAGVTVGQIGNVSLEDGRAIVELEFEPEYRGLVREDATALLRTKTGLKDMFVEVDPGEGAALSDGGRIRLQNTAPDIDPDEILAALDSDTRDYLKLLVSGLGKGLSGRGSDLREALARLGPLHQDLARVTKAVADRRVNLRRLVHDYGLLVELLGRKDRDLTALVSASNAVFGALAGERRNVAELVARLPGTLRQTEATLGKVDLFAQRLGPTLARLRPGFAKLDQTNGEVLALAQEATPIVRDQIRPFARDAQPYFEQFGAGVGELARAAPDLTDSVHELNRLLNIGAFNPGGAEGLTGDLARDRARNEGFLYWAAWVSQNTTSIFNVQDAHGPLRRLTLGGLNCQTLPAVASQAGLPPLQADVALDLFNAIGACAK